MAYQCEIRDFSGPLDLLLQLVQEKKKDITDIVLSEITDQYLGYITQMGESVDPHEISDFLLVASRLLYVKTKVLLPQLHLEDDENETDLSNQLRIYREFAEAAKQIHKMYLRPAKIFRVLPSPQIIQTRFRPASNATPQNMLDILNKLLKRIRPIIKIPKALLEKTVTLQEKITQLKSLVAKIEKISFHEHFKDKTVSERVVSFIAVLELIKQRIVMVEQNENFGEIIIIRK